MRDRIPEIIVDSPSPPIRNSEPIHRDSLGSEMRKSQMQNSKRQTREPELTVPTTRIYRKQDDHKMPRKRSVRKVDASKPQHTQSVSFVTENKTHKTASRDKRRKDGQLNNTGNENRVKEKAVGNQKEETYKNTGKDSKHIKGKALEEVLHVNAQPTQSLSTSKLAKSSTKVVIRQKALERIKHLEKQVQPKTTQSEIEQNLNSDFKNLELDDTTSRGKSGTLLLHNIDREKMKVHLIDGVVILNPYERRRQYDQMLRKRTKMKAELDRLRKKGTLVDALKESDEHRYAEALQNDNSFERFHENVSFASNFSEVVTTGNSSNKRKLSATVKPMIRNDLNKNVQIAFEKNETGSSDSKSSMDRTKTFTKDKSEAKVSSIEHAKGKIRSDPLHQREGQLSVSKEPEIRNNRGSILKYHPRIHNRVHEKRPLRLYSEVESSALNKQTLTALHQNRSESVYLEQRLNGKLHDLPDIRYGKTPQTRLKTSTQNKSHIHDFAERYVLQRDELHNEMRQITFPMTVQERENFKSNPGLKHSSENRGLKLSDLSHFDTHFLTQNHLLPRQSFLEIVIKPDNRNSIAFKETISPNTTEQGSTHVYVKSGKVSAYLHPYNAVDGEGSHRSQSEIPVYSDDEFDVYNPQRPYTDTYREMPMDQGRYDEKLQNSDSLQKPHRTLNGKGKLVTFYRNGDEYFKGLTISITPKTFLNFETLLVHLNDKIETTTGVKYIFAYPSGKEVKSVTEFLPGRCYLVSTNKKPILNIDYGRKSKEQHWVNRRPSGGPMRKGEQELFRKPNEHISLKHQKPRVITVFKNEERERKEKVYINPMTKQTFEDLLITIGDMIEEDIHALYTEKKPYKKVESFSQLFNEFKNHNEFIACGPELYPSEKRAVPSSNSSSDSGWKKRFSRLNERGDLEELDENDRDYSLSPVPNMDHNGMLTSRDLPLVPPQRPLADDWIKFEIKGKDRYYYPPTVVYPDDNGARPGKKLKLEWLYGFRGKEGSQSLMVYEPTGELLYYMAAVAIFLWKDERDKSGGSQRHYLGHTDDITCLTIHPNEFLVASGQCSSKNSPAHVRIWDGRQLTTHHVIGMDFFESGISAIDFSQQSSGNFMCVSDSSDKHILSVWDWSRNPERLIAKTTTTNQAVNCACFYKYDDTLLITYGVEHLYFWRLFWDPVIERVGKLYRDKLSGVFKEVPKNITAHAFTSNGDVITGDSSGSIIVWTKDSEYVFIMNKNLSSDAICAHTHSVTALCMMKDGTCLSGGGTSIKAWSPDFKCISGRDISDASGHVRAIIPHRRSGYDGKIYVGTSKSCILSGSLLNKFQNIVFGHSDEVWCAQHITMYVPRDKKGAFITAGQDRLVIKWLSNSHWKEWDFEVDAPVSAMSVDNQGQFVAVGTDIGRFTVLRVSNGEPLLSVHCSAAQINTMSYSPDCTKLALGTYDGQIHIFRVYEEGEHYRKMKVPLKGHETFINNLDWDANSKFLRSCDADFDEKFWKTQYMEPVDGDILRNCNWETHTCCAGYSMMGPWTACEENETLAVVSRSHTRDIMAVGDNKGRIKLFKYPSSKHMSSCRWTKLYSSTVTALAFMSSDTHLLSCAGKYPVLAQWAVVDTAVGH